MNFSALPQELIDFVIRDDNEAILISQVFSSDPCSVLRERKWTCAWAAEGGYLEVLKWAIENDCPWDEQTCSRAAARDYLEVLKWLRTNGCPWSAVSGGVVPD